MTDDELEAMMADWDNDAVVVAINAHAAQAAEAAHEARQRSSREQWCTDTNADDGEAGPLTREISIAPPILPRTPRLRRDAGDGWAFEEIASAPSRRL